MDHRRLVALTAVALLTGLPIASATANAERTKSGQYHVVVGSINESDPSAEGEFSNAVTFTPRAQETFVVVSIEDRSGLPTRALVVQERQSEHGPRYVLKKEICGSTDEPIAIRSQLEVTVLVQDGPCADGTTAVATFGTVTATFTR